jgi:membrane dipeptidase
MSDPPTKAHSGLTRRDFAASLGITLAATLLESATMASVDRGSAIYRTALVLDCNSIGEIGQLCCDKDTESLLQIMRSAGVNVLKSTLGAPQATFEDAAASVAATQNLVDRFPKIFFKAVSYMDFDRAKREGKIAIIFSFEGVRALEESLERIHLFRQSGVRVMQIVYNRKSLFGCGCLDGDGEGLTMLGHQAVALMDELGIAIDTSHANTATTRDAIEASNKPTLITHAGCRAVFSHPRNKEDHVMRAMASKGGVMGIYMLPFLTEDTRQPSLDDYMRHMVHALDICGEDHIGIGTDVPFFEVTDKEVYEMRQQEEQRKASGIGAPGENRPPYIPDLNTPRKLELVAGALLKYGYSDRIVEKVLGLNFRRAFRDIWGG